MKKFLSFVFSCLVIVLLVDVLFGTFCNWYVKDKPLPGDYENVDYLIKRSTDDVIILGSSIALNSLMPTIVEDSLGMTCFNGGANGQTLTFYDTMVECILARHKPKMIVLGLKNEELAGTGVGGRYNFLVPYYDKGYSMIDSCLKARDKYEPYLLKSNLYRYNTIWWRILLYHFITPGEPGEKGFVAKGIPSFYPTLYKKEVSTQISNQRKEEFRSMVERCRNAGVQLVAYFPPNYYKYSGKSATINYVENYCKEHNIPCFDDSQDAEFLKNKEWFYDNVHLNKNGAVIYTEHFIAELKEDSCKTERR